MRWKILICKSYTIHILLLLISDSKTSRKNLCLYLFYLFQCVPIQGRGFETGGYKCECKQGYEYPFEDPITYVDGQFTESEFNNMVVGKETRYDMLKCRLASATQNSISFSVILAAFILLYMGIPAIRRLWSPHAQCSKMQKKSAIWGISRTICF